MVWGISKIWFWTSCLRRRKWGLNLRRVTSMTMWRYSCFIRIGIRKDLEQERPCINLSIHRIYRSGWTWLFGGMSMRLSISYNTKWIGLSTSQDQPSLLLSLNRSHIKSNVFSSISVAIVIRSNQYCCKNHTDQWSVWLWIIPLFRRRMEGKHNCLNILKMPSVLLLHKWQRKAINCPLFVLKSNAAMKRTQ